MSTVRGKRGILINAPMGSGKTYWINQLPESERSKWQDGDTLLELAGIKNRNIYWYQPGYGRFHQRVKDLFREWLLTGHNIFYSPNPVELMGDVLILPDMQKRAQFLEGRREQGGFCPNNAQFKIEQEHYQHMADSNLYAVTIQSDIPSLAEMQEIQSRLGDTPVPF